MTRKKTAEAVRVYYRNHKFEQGPCSVKPIRDLTEKHQEIEWTCERPQSGRSSVPFEIITGVHKSITADVQIPCIPQEVEQAVWMHWKQQTSRF